VPRLTYQTAIVLFAIAQGYRYGFEIIDATGLGAGTVYPILRRLEHAHLLASAWERVPSRTSLDRPPRCYFRLTGAGSAVLRDARARYPGLSGVLAAHGDPAPLVTRGRS
jgi:DNA-binding PadR family transcriptional regulator